VVRAKLVTDDKRRRGRDRQPFASDHYPVVVVFQWHRGQNGAEGAGNSLAGDFANVGAGFEF